MLRARPALCHACPYWNYNNVDTFGIDLCLNQHVLAVAKDRGIVVDTERASFWAVPRLVAWQCCVCGPRDMDVPLPGAHVYIAGTNRPLGNHFIRHDVPPLGRDLL